MKASIIYRYFPDLSDHQRHQVEALQELYRDWNDKINVISRKDIDQLYERHVLHSLAIARFHSFAEGTRVLDIGTGGGFPGIPLAILFPGSSFLLVDSIGKKIRVVNEVAQAIGLKNVEGQHARAEKIRDKFDFVVSRAVARTKMLYNWSHQMIRPSDHATSSNGFILLKGGDLEEELQELNRPHSVIEIQQYFTEAFFQTKKIVYIPV